MKKRRFQGMLTIKEEEALTRLLRSCRGVALFVLVTWLLVFQQQLLTLLR